MRSKKDEVLDDDPDWWEGVGRFVKDCPGCGSFAPVYPQPLNAVVQNRQRSTIALSGRSGYWILKRVFYELLKPNMPGVVPGEVRFGDGRVQRDSVTVNLPSEMYVVLRGGHGSRARAAYRTCSVCGRRISSLAMLTKPLHVLRNEIPNREVLYTGGFLAITASLSRRLDFGAFPDIVLQSVGVFDTPVECIPEIGDAEPESSPA